MIHLENTEVTKVHPLRKHLTGIVLLIGIIVVGIVYVSMTLTPSHYGVVLDEFLGLDYQPLVGEARAIREDEYGVTTPYFQIAVNNDFQRFNQTSPYGEDLRHFLGLPLQDWALVFKPYMWGFWILGAARALSFYHYFMIASFLIGFTLFLNRLKLPLSYAAIITAILFFSHLYQVFWSNNAPLLALTVWLIIPFLFKWSYPLKFLATFYISMMALLALIYPSWQISLIYTFIVLALVFRKECFTLANIATCGTAFVAAGGFTYVYLQDNISLIQNTIYPGQVHYSGGTSASYFLWAQLAPHGLVEKFFQPIIWSPNINTTEIATVSSLLLTLILSFTNYAWVIKNIPKNIWKYSISFVFLTIVLAWMLLPIPSDIGRFLLFDRIGPHRFVLAFGTFVVSLSAFIAFQVTWVFSWFRLLVYSAVLIAVPVIVYFKQHKTIDFRAIFDTYDLLAISTIIIIIVIKFSKFSIKPRLVAYVFALTALSYNAISFGHFNPLQEANDIFSEDIQAKVTQLKKELHLSKHNLIAYEGSKPINSALAGLDLPTLHHTFLVPQIQFYQEKFPELSSQEINIVFNRFSKIGTVDKFTKPTLVNSDLVGIPGRSAATIITSEVNLQDYSEKSTSMQQAYINDVWWSETEDNKRFLTIDFYHPTVVDMKSAVASIGLDLDIQENSNVHDVSVTASIIAKPNLAHFLSQETPNIPDNTIWQLFLEFKSENAHSLNQLPQKLNNLYINDFQSSSLLYPSKNITVEDLHGKSSEPYKSTQTHYGYIDQIGYQSESQTLVITGWTPVEDFPTPRWFGYKSSDDFEFKTVSSVLRADVPLTQGKNLMKGFELSFSVKDYQENTSIPLCLYSSTEALGIFPISTGKYDLACGVDDVIQELQQPLVSSTSQGNIDVAYFDELSQTLLIQGWAPPSLSFAQERWFGYLSNLEIVESKVISVARPDVAKVFGESYAFAGFEINLKLPESLDDNSPIDFCLYGRTDELGEFNILSNNSRLICKQ